MQVDPECTEWADRTHTAEQDYEALLDQIRDYAASLMRIPGATSFHPVIAAKLRALIGDEDART